VKHTNQLCGQNVEVKPGDKESKQPGFKLLMIIANKMPFTISLET